jgi:hypothetical protein
VVFHTDAADVSYLEGAPFVDHGLAPPDLHVEQPTLEEVFLSLTGHSLRE